MKITIVLPGFLINCVNARFFYQFIGFKDRRGRDRMVVGFTTIYAISAYHH
jgi:hypothetical protein